LIDDNVTVKGMFIEEWLHRLNLLQYKKHFLKQKLRRVEDLIHIIDEGQIAEHTLADNDKLVSRRMWNMLIGDTETKENFKYLSKHGIRSIGAVFLSNPRDLDELVN